MARRKGQSLGRRDVVLAALACVEEGGPDALNVNRVAQRLGIRTPSLYNHVEGADDLRQAVLIEILERAGTQVVVDADETVDPEVFILAYARAVRRYAIENSNLYQFLTLSVIDWRDSRFSPHWATGANRLAVAVAGLGVPTALRENAVRTLLSAIHGFSRQETRGSWGGATNLDQSFDWMIGLLIDALKRLALPAATFPNQTQVGVG